MSGDVSAIPSLVDAVASWLISSVFVAIITAGVAGIVCPVHHVSVRRQTVAILAVVVLGVALCGAMAALVHHAAWVDYRRGGGS